KRDSTGVDDGDVKLLFDLKRVADTHDLQAVPVLEEIFDQRRSHTLSVRALQSKLPSASSHGESRFETEWRKLEDELHIASVLIKLGVKDDVYWNYLAEQVQAIVRINIPFPFKTDAQEGPNPSTSPEFTAWVKSRNLDQDEAVIYQLTKMPIPVLLLAMMDDPRGIPLLRQGLKSANPIIQMVSADGLAQLHDNESVPLSSPPAKKSPSRNATRSLSRFFISTIPRPRPMPRSIYRRKPTSPSASASPRGIHLSIDLA